MSMTKEEAIKRPKGLKARCKRLIVSSERNPEEWRKDAEAVEMALSALRPVSRERVERMRSQWITVVEVNGEQYSKCVACQTGLDGLEDAYLFCPHCGAPMTDEAVEMVMERWEALKDGN